MKPVTKAMLLCAGLGTRMRPLTNDKPKPLIEVNGRTLLDRSLDWFEASGIGEVVINTHYLAPMIEAHVKGRTSPKTMLSYEPVLLETGGGIKKALPMLGNEPFFCANGDALCIDGKSPALQRMQQVWNDSEMDALLLVVPKNQAVGFDGPGDFSVDDKGGIIRRGNAAEAPFIFSGIQLLHPRLFNASPDGAFSMNVLYDRSLHRTKAVVHDGPWLHVGDPEGLKQAEAFLTK